MSILIKGMKMPEDTVMTINIWADGRVYILGKNPMMLHDAAVEIPDHGDLIDRDELSAAMYHEAFETDSKMQKWDSGCWIRYALFEKKRDAAPVVIPAERSEE